MTGDSERRLTVGRVELRAEAGSRLIGGYAAKTDRQSKNLGGFVERIAPGFFAKSAGDGWPEVQARYNHDDNMLLGTTGGGTLRVWEDKIGLQYEVDVPLARQDVLELVQRGDIGKSSFAFIAFEDEWTQNDLGIPLRTLVSGKLIDVAPVNIPAYDDTSVGAMRSLADKMHASLEEVRALAATNDLSKFFVKTGEDAKRPNAAARLALAKSIEP